jgi:hypothetical protein
MTRDRFEKIMAVAVNPGAYDDEAVAALHKAREMVKHDPSLAHPAPPPPAPVSKPLPPDHSIGFRVTQVSSFWLNILIGSLSAEAYGLDLKSKFSFDFSVVPTAVDIRCDGSQVACDAFTAHLNWLIAHINAQPPK